VTTLSGEVRGKLFLSLGKGHELVYGVGTFSVNLHIGGDLRTICKKL
jgi:hypothetical protein